MSTPEEFQEEEELRLILEGWGRQHDCVEAGCTLNLDGEEIPPAKPSRRKRTGLKRAKELWKKYREGELE